MTGGKKTPPETVKVVGTILWTESKLAVAFCPERWIYRFQHDGKGAYGDFQAGQVVDIFYTKEALDRVVSTMQVIRDLEPI